MEQNDIDNDGGRVCKTDFRPERRPLYRYNHYNEEYKKPDLLRTVTLNALIKEWGGTENVRKR